MFTKKLSQWIDYIDLNIVRWLARYSLTFLRVGMGLVFLWFGALKFFPNLSPATDLAVRTIDVLSLGLIPGDVSIILLATLETLIGLGFLSGRFMRLTLLLLLFQMAGTMTPLGLFPAEAFMQFPYAPTLEGQYIIKNLVLIGAGLVIGATVRGGQIVPEPSQQPGASSNMPAHPAPVEQTAH